MNGKDIDDKTIAELTGTKENEQIETAISNTATWLCTFYNGLINGDMPPEYALVLTRDYYAFLVRPRGGK